MFPISRAPPLGQAPGFHPGREFGGGPATCGHCPVPGGRQGLLPALCQSRRWRAAAFQLAFLGTQARTPSAAVFPDVVSLSEACPCL